MPPVVTSEAYVYTLTTCERTAMDIACEGRKEIHIVYANYGRLDMTTCIHRAMSNTDCRADTSLAVVKEECEGSSSCTVTPSNTIFGDPCGGTYKYLEVQYTCSG